MKHHHSLLAAAVMAGFLIWSVGDANAASPRQTVLLGPITDSTIPFGGGAAAGLNSSATAGTAGVLVDFDTDASGPNGAQVAFEWESFDTDLSGFNNFALNLNPAIGSGIGSAQVFIRSEDPANPGTTDFNGGGSTPLTEGVDNLVNVDFSSVMWPQNIIGFGLQMFSGNASATGASVTISTAQEFTVTEDVLYDFNAGLDGWTEGFQPEHTHSLIGAGAADGTQALGISRAHTGTSFRWGSQHVLDADPDMDEVLDPAVVAEIADLADRVNAAEAIGFDVTIKDPFPASPGFAGFHLAIQDGNNFYQRSNGDFFNATPTGGPETHRFEAELSDFKGFDPGPTQGRPITEAGFTADNFALFAIASNTDGAGNYEIDNFRLISRAAANSADFDLDSDVDADDLEMWQSAFGGNNDGDADFDGNTRGSDFLAWQRQLSGTPSLVGANAVPEPSAVVLLVTCGALCWSRRRREIR